MQKMYRLSTCKTDVLCSFPSFRLHNRIMRKSFFLVESDKKLDSNQDSLALLSAMYKISPISISPSSGLLYRLDYSSGKYILFKCTNVSINVTDVDKVIIINKLSFGF